MKKIFVFLVLGILAISLAGCNSGSGSAANLIGTWAWAQVRLLPSPGATTGAMIVQTVSGNHFSGIINLITPSAAGPYIFEGTLNGTVATVSYFNSTATETWTMTVTGNNFSGSWSYLNVVTYSGTITGNKI